MAVPAANASVSLDFSLKAQWRAEEIAGPLLSKRRI